jgi:DNA transformation protein
LIVARKAPARRPAGGKTFRSLKVSPGFKAFVLDQLEELGEVTPRPMFGGVGLYHRGVFFGIMAMDTLYLKVDATNRADYEREGMTRFNPYNERVAKPVDKDRARQYCAVPAGVLESAHELADWARKALVVARSG